MKYKHIFFDLDHTIWDFDANAKSTLLSLHNELHLKEKGVNDFDAFYTTYLMHNEKLWSRYRKGLIAQADLRIKRMRNTLLDFNIIDEDLANEMNHLFLKHLPTRNLVFPDTFNLLDYLKDKNYHLHLITNGFEEVQHLKLKHSQLQPYFKEVITSEKSNSLKPNPEIFKFAMDATNAKVEESIMIGDDIEADIMGAANMGIDQIWVNHTQKQTEFIPTYIVDSLLPIKNIL
ncbi:MAG: noncanonical pyrimidine nucleotidase, YjjG family [Chitinophagaceae bacterium]|nr:MAG: noncanonical pyrimidine nucleotidase, YjjG family [Chitinophagaceae bacterium]